MGTVFSSSTTDKEQSSLNKLITFFGNYIYKSLIFVFVFCLFTINLIAVSISLQCNKKTDANIFFKISSAVFAFMFGIFYIIINYYMYRVQILNNPCVICNTNIFGF